MTRKFTLGPWVPVIDRDKAGIITHAGIDTADRSVQVGSVCLENIDAYNDPQVEADCHLMAAAPRMLDACELALASLRAVGVENATMRLLEAVIAEAKGGA